MWDKIGNERPIHFGELGAFFLAKMARNTDKQRVFVETYLQTWNASEAARRAGYRGRANQIGYRLLTNVDIRAAIERRLSELAMNADEVIARLAAMARGDLSPFVTEAGTIDLTTEIARENMFLVKRIKTKERRGTNDKNEDWEEVYTEIELHDPQAALVHIGRHLKLFTDKFETDDGLSEPERIARIVEILDAARERQTRSLAVKDIISEN